MAREHLYRAKRVNWRELPQEEQWVEGYYVKHGSRHWIYTGEIQYMYYPVCADLPTKYEVEKETVCEYTGLTDKNTKKVFEEDILNVTYSDQIGECHYAENYVLDDLRSTSVIGWLDYANELEVVGNIFDNPELSKED